MHVLYVYMYDVSDVIATTILKTSRLWRSDSFRLKRFKIIYSFINIPIDFYCSVTFQKYCLNEIMVIYPLLYLRTSKNFTNSHRKYKYVFKHRIDWLQLNYWNICLLVMQVSDRATRVYCLVYYKSVARKHLTTIKK
jgi:hypothetical protein